MRGALEKTYDTSIMKHIIYRDMYIYYMAVSKGLETNKFKNLIG